MFRDIPTKRETIDAKGVGQSQLLRRETTQVAFDGGV